MSFRRRGSTKRSSAAYSSPDFYRSLRNPTFISSGSNVPSAPSSTGHGSEDDGIVIGGGRARVPPPSAEDQAPVSSTSHDDGQTAHTQTGSSSPHAVVAAEGSAEPTSTDSTSSDAHHELAASSGNADSPLSPPRPLFHSRSKRGSAHTNSDRGSWSTASLDHASDSDVPSDTGEHNVAPGADARRAIGRERSITNPNVLASARGVGTQIRPRNHHRQRSVPDDGTVVSSPFDTPPSSIYVPTPGVISSTSGIGVADRTSTGSRAPPSAFLPFQSHPGNPDPGMPIPGVTRRASLESMGRANARPLSGGSVFTTATGFGALRPSSDIGHGASASEVSFDRPYAPCMDATGRDGSATPPSPNASQSNLYRNSAAAGMSGSTAALAGNGMRFS